MNLRRALILYAAYKAAREPGQFGDLLWVSSTADYHYEATGRPVSKVRIEEAWKQYLGDMSQDVDRFTDSLLRGRTSVDAWRRQLRDHMADAMRIGYITGRGGEPQMTAGDWGKVGAEIRRQYAYIDNFAQQLAAGEAGTPAQIANRAGMYARAPTKMCAAGARTAKESAGYARERRIARMDAGTCAACAELAGKGWQPIGSLPLPGEATPCGANCRCVMDYAGNPILKPEEVEFLYDKVQQEWAAEHFSGFTYNVLTDKLESEGYALSIHPERERAVPMDRLSLDDINDYAIHNADKIKDQSKFPYRFGAWTNDAGDFVMDVSMLLPKANIVQAALNVIKYEQDAMFELHTFTELSRDDCISLLIGVGMLPEDYTDSMTRKSKSIQVHKDAQVTARPNKRWLMMVSPPYPGRKDPGSGERHTFEDYMAHLYDIGEFLHRYHGASAMTPRSNLQFIMRQYRSNPEEDIERFWKARPELRPMDWEENRDIYLNGHPDRWKRLAWDEGLDLPGPD